MSSRRSSPMTTSLRRLRSRKTANRTRLAQEVNQTHTTEVVLLLRHRLLLNNNNLLLRRPMGYLLANLTALLRDSNPRMVHHQVSPLPMAHLLANLRHMVRLQHRLHMEHLLVSTHRTVPLLTNSMERHNSPMEPLKATTTVVRPLRRPLANRLAHLSARPVGTLSTTRILNVGIT